MQRRRPIAKLALVALLVAGAGTYAAMRYTHTPTPPLPSVPAVLKAVPARANAVVREIRQVPAVLHRPTELIQHTAGSAAAAHPAPAKPAAAPHREWERQPLGRGEIIQHH